MVNSDGFFSDFMSKFVISLFVEAMELSIFIKKKSK